ncbi:hypothetical protein HEP_00471800, partial [Hepatocystis sp. ex Piliocolobus tephrosceles]
MNNKISQTVKGKSKKNEVFSNGLVNKETNYVYDNVNKNVQNLKKNRNKDNKKVTKKKKKTTKENCESNSKLVNNQASNYKNNSVIYMGDNKTGSNNINDDSINGNSNISENS